MFGVLVLTIIAIESVSGTCCPTIDRFDSVLDSTGSNCYVYSTTWSKNWEDSRKFCKELGMHFATLRAPEDLSILWNALQETGTSAAWVGLFQDPLGAEPDQGWYWDHDNETGLQGDDIVWAENEPNERYAGEDCGIIWSEDGLNDAACDVSWSMVCETACPDDSSSILTTKDSSSGGSNEGLVSDTSFYVLGSCILVLLVFAVLSVWYWKKRREEVFVKPQTIEI